MKKTKHFIAASLATALAFSATASLGSDLFIYPNNGQTSEQQQRDRYECHIWAKDQTGYDPSQTGLTMPAPPQNESNSNSLKGAVSGAALGAAVGAVTGKSVGETAAIGAGAGLLTSRMKNRRAEKKAEKTYEAELANSQAYIHAKNTEYNRAISACLTGRGYTVS